MLCYHSGMDFLIRPAAKQDISDLSRLATSQSAYGFLNLPDSLEKLSHLIDLSERSFAHACPNKDDCKYLFVLEDHAKNQVVGSSLILARHGTPEMPHVFFRVDETRRTLTLCWDTEGRTELGGLLMDTAYRGHPEKLGKRLSYVRLFYIFKNASFFKEKILAELLPRFSQDGESPFWNSIGVKMTGLTYREADQRSRIDQKFVRSYFPSGSISLASLSPEAREVMGKPGPQTERVARMLEQIGFRYLHEVDPLDGGPHYGAHQKEINRQEIENFLTRETSVEINWPDRSSRSAA